MVSLLHGRFRLSMRATTVVFAELFGAPLGPGSVSALCRETSAALDQPYEQVRARVEAEIHANVDETGWKQAGERRWLWVAVTVLCTLFVVAKSRRTAVLRTVLGETFAGVVSSDRSKAYRSIPLERRQICWAHLKPPLLGFAERSGEIGAWGQEAVSTVAKVFTAWYRFKEEGGDRATLQQEIAPLRTELRALWERGTTLPSCVVRAFCNDVRALEPARWTFVTVEGVEPTNNAAERWVPSGPRPAVLWRKSCFGAGPRGYPAAGNAFVAKILTVAATCRQQQRHLLSCLADTVAAHRANQPVPSLLPTTRTVITVD
jgi:transposase